MKNPQSIETVNGASYLLPTYEVGDNGLDDVDYLQVDFVKGNKSDPNIYRQPGIITESLIQCAIQYLTTVNVGDLASRETSLAITKLEEALFWITKRAEDRKLRGVQGTYQK